MRSTRLSVSARVRPMPMRSDSSNTDLTPVTEHSSMTKTNWLRVGIPAFVAAMLAAGPALADPTINKGDTTWMMTATVLVLCMTIPGFALFYVVLVSYKNMLMLLL